MERALYRGVEHRGGSLNKKRKAKGLLPVAARCFKRHVFKEEPGSDFALFFDARLKTAPGRRILLFYAMSA
jgi:hypothetical protein